MTLRDDIVDFIPPRKAFHLLSEIRHTGFGGIDEVATA